MCIQKLIGRPSIPIYMGGEHPHEHNLLSLKENHGSVSLLFIFSGEPVSVNEPYHQVGDRVMDQIVIRQSLLDAVSGPENSVLTQATAGYLFGRRSNNGVVIVDGVVFAEDREPGLLRLDPSRTLNGILESRMRTRGVTIVGTISYADYYDWSITERGLTEKIADMPHMFVLARGSTSYNEVAVITPKQGGGEVHAGIGIVEHGGSIEWGIVTSVREIKEPAIEVRLL